MIKLPSILYQKKKVIAFTKQQKSKMKTLRIMLEYVISVVWSEI